MKLTPRSPQRRPHSSLKLSNSPHTGPWGRARHRWSINCDALRCAYLYTRLPSVTSRTARDSGRVIVLCTASAVGADGAQSTHWMPTEDWGALALCERCVVACQYLYTSCTPNRRKSCAEARRMPRPGSDRIKISGRATVSSCNLNLTQNRTPVTRACRQKLTGVCDTRAMQPQWWAPAGAAYGQRQAYPAQTSTGQVFPCPHRRS